MRTIRSLKYSRWFLITLGLLITFGSISYYPLLIQNWPLGHIGLVKWCEVPIEVLGAILVLTGVFVGRHWQRMKTIRWLTITTVILTGATYTYHTLSESGKIEEWLNRSSAGGTLPGEIKESMPSLAGTLGGLKLVLATDPTTEPIHNSTANTSQPTKTATYVALATPTRTPSPTPGPNTSRVWVGNAYISGVYITNNPDAKNPLWAQLVTFLQNDPTDKQKYDYGSFVCADFAEMLHNNAEKAGIRAAYVTVKLSGYRDFANLGIPSNTGHALNAFETTDRGLVFIDSTATTAGKVKEADKTVDVAVGKEYIPKSIFPEPGWSSTWESMGTVLEIEVIQW